MDEPKKFNFEKFLINTFTSIRFIFYILLKMRLPFILVPPIGYMEDIRGIKK